MGTRKRTTDCAAELDALFEKEAAVTAEWGRSSTVWQDACPQSDAVPPEEIILWEDGDPTGSLLLPLQQLSLRGHLQDPTQVSPTLLTSKPPFTSLSRKDPKGQDRSHPRR